MELLTYCDKFYPLPHAHCRLDYTCCRRRILSNVCLGGEALGYTCGRIFSHRHSGPPQHSRGVGSSETVRFIKGSSRFGGAGLLRNDIYFISGMTFNLSRFVRNMVTLLYLLSAEVSDSGSALRACYNHRSRPHHVLPLASKRVSKHWQ